MEKRVWTDPHALAFLGDRRFSDPALEQGSFVSAPDRSHSGDLLDCLVGFGRADLSPHQRPPGHRRLHFHFASVGFRCFYRDNLATGLRSNAAEIPCVVDTALARVAGNLWIG